MQLYADEDFTFPVVEALRGLGHDVVTAQEDGRAAADDPDILARAHELQRSLLTHNHWDFQRLARKGAAHSGIIGVTRDKNVAALAARIDAAIRGSNRGRWCMRINRPSKP
jgi:predicted nuclease of predicted toxin-antitoxin system